jgi:hypothetical protein
VATHRISLEKLGPVLGAYLDRAVVVLQEELREAVVETAFTEVVDRSPVGNPSTDPHSGKYRASHSVSVGSIQTRDVGNMPSYPIPGAEMVSAALNGSDPAASVFIANGAVSGKAEYPYGKAALEPGRRQYTRTGSRTTMWIGSEQAPDGIYGPAVRALLGMRGTIQDKAVRRARERLG